MEVDDKMLEALDKLEAHPVYYTREKINVLPDDDSSTPLECWAYLLKDYKPELLHGDTYSNYDSYGQHGLQFIPRFIRRSDLATNPPTAWAIVKTLSD